MAFYLQIGIVTVSAYLVYKFQTIKVAPGFKSTFSYRSIIVVMKAFNMMIRVLSLLGFASRPIILKKFLGNMSAASPRTDSDNVKVEDRKIGDIPVRIYSPKDQTNALPAVVYYHGGGYVIGSIESNDLLMYTIAKRLNAVLISVGYRLAPENVYPIPMDDCWNVTDYILTKPGEFNINKQRVALAGDSAGGALAATISQRLLRENKQSPKLQVLIYPWMQHFNFQLPSYKYYLTHKALPISFVSLIELVVWTLGVTKGVHEIETALEANEHSLLIEDEDLRRKYASYMDVDLIPEEYKMGHDYYNNYKKYSFADASLSKNSILRKNTKLADLVKNLFNEDLSPGLVSDDVLRKQPKTYVAICEYDELKDEALIYAERLRRNGVATKIAYYEHGYHGIIGAISKEFHNTIAAQMVDDLTSYLQNNL